MKNSSGKLEQKIVEKKLLDLSDTSQEKRRLGKYIPANIEVKWQEQWGKEKLYTFEPQENSDPYYNLVELPYPSGDLHLGHWFSFVCPDAHARYMRMNGYNVFFPNGFDAFGLPAENAAIKRGIHPHDWTMKNIETMKKQFATMGTMIDWSHEAITCLPEYYLWNQWIFIKMFERGLAYRGKALSNWCPSCQTVLANEGIEAGKCWRCGSVVEQKEIAQWFLRITDYADKLLWSDLDKNGLSNGVDWPQSVREGQNNWIGRSEGLEITFRIPGRKESITVYTVFPETIFGVTYMVLAPEHPIAQKLATKEQAAEVSVYIKSAKEKTELERKTLDKEKTGVFTGSFCINPVTGEEIPVWIGDYVIAAYGTGAVMGVPGSDHRDYAFAKKYNLDIKKVIGTTPGDNETITSEEGILEEGVLVNSGEFSGQKTPHPAREIMKDWMAKQGFAKRKVQYHLHDWSISRQRYWGTPVPMIHCDSSAGGCGIVPVPLDDLPVKLPYEVDYTPKGKPPLATAEKWLNVKCPKCGKDAKRDAETLDTFFDSSWYYYRYVSPDEKKAPFDKLQVKELMPLDIYFGGSEHTLGHTLYARFFTKFFKELGLVGFDEFAKKRVQHGIILGPDGNRMSKSKGNVVNPDDVVRVYGADTVRLYLCFMMPYEATAPWNPTAISGIFRFLRRVWDLYEKCQMSNDKYQISNDDLFWMHKTVKKVGEDLGDIKFNTAVASLMEWLNHLSRKETISIEEYKTMLLLLAPLAPHIAEELFQILQNSKSDSVHLQEWPMYDEKYLVEDEVTIVVQVNGKVRENLRISKSEVRSQKFVEDKAVESEKVKGYLEGKTVKNVIYIEGKLLNFVAS